LARRTGQNDRLRRAREERNWTQADVAQAIGTSSFTVSRWELGVQVPQPHFREKLCSLFTLSPQELGLVGRQPANGLAADRPAGALGEVGDRAEARARRDLLAQVWRYWIETELEAAVGTLPRIELALTKRPDVVDDPRCVRPASGHPDRPLPPGTTVEAAYDRAGEQLLVLGDPGAGKTTSLLDLARTLLERTAHAPSGPMPVVFHLSSWAEARQPLDGWLVEELHRRYGVARRLGRAWIGGEQVVPLLDGLDEVAEEHRAACVEAINEFHGEHGQLPLVVCCRTAQYQSLGVRLRLRGAVVIRPLTREQVERYLAQAGDDVAEVRTLLQEDERLRELLTTPLFLSMVVRTYGAERAARPPLRGPLPERRRRVLADYVDEMLTRPRAAATAAAYTPGRTAGWLAWLARAMHDRGEGVFYLDWMQPSWLPTPAQRRLVRLAPALLVVLVGGVVGVLDMLLASLLLGAHTYLLDVGGGMRVDLPGRLAGGVLAGAAVGVMAGLLAAAFTYERRIAPTDRLAWSWSTFRRNLPSVLAAVLGAMLLSLLVDRILAGLVIHLVYGLLLVLLFGALTGRRRRWQLAVLLGAALAAGAAVLIATGEPLSTLLFRLSARLLVGLSLGLMFGPETPLCGTVPAPGRAIEMSRRHGLAAGAVSGGLAMLVFGAVAGAGVGRTLGTSVALVTGIVDGACMGMIVAVGVSMRRGFGAYVRHALLRRLLARAGAAPRDYVAFLEHASNLILLRRRGGGYEFVHRLLLDHFAELGATTAASMVDRRATGRSI
jgi:eukaryotic-like serine/threonine-protein kinase